MQRVCTPLNLSIGKLIGGRPLSRDQPTLAKKNQIIVATPGRLIEHINTKRLKVGDVKFLVFDESDQMFDDGFFDDCVYLLERVSMQVQILLCSATITDKVHEFAHNGIQNYDELIIGSAIPAQITQEKLFCPIREKNDLLVELFSLQPVKRALVFTNTKLKCEQIVTYLKEHRLKAEVISSDLDQKHREQRLAKFTDGSINILVATDIAARGLHIPDVDLVLNYDVPTRTEFYIHRIGRTGRTKAGRALTFICPEDEDRFIDIEYRYFLDVQELDIMFRKVESQTPEE
jgi:superfamily II DNA/RNA helicase